MKIRKYNTNDCSEIVQLFYNTVHTINAQDYTKKQLDAWATGNVDAAAWDKSFLEHYTVAAEESGIIVGFGDLDCTGYFDKLFVHREYQGIGIATAIANELERYAAENRIDLISVHASITAKPFFEKRGYKTIKEQQVKRDGEELTNFIMEKCLLK